MKNILVSILVANYNYEEFISETIESVLQQSYNNFELIICDDGSRDNSLEIIKHYLALDSRIKLFKQENSGQASALNKCYNHSKGELIALLDSDDLFDKTKLELVVKKYEESPSNGLIIHKLRKIDKKGTIIGSSVPNNLANGDCRDLLIKNGGRFGLPPSSGIIISRKITEMIFPINDEFKTNADGVITECAQSISTINSIEQVLGSFRIHGNNISSNFYSYPNEELLLKTILITEKTFVNTKKFLSSKNIPINEFYITNSKNYNLQCMAYYIFSNSEYLSKIHQKSIKEMKEILDNKNRLMFSFLLLLPKYISRKILKILWGQNILKNIVAKVLR